MGGGYPYLFRPPTLQAEFIVRGYHFILQPIQATIQAKRKRQQNITSAVGECRPACPMRQCPQLLDHGRPRPLAETPHGLAGRTGREVDGTAIWWQTGILAFVMQYALCAVIGPKSRLPSGLANHNPQVMRSISFSRSGARVGDQTSTWRAGGVDSKSTIWRYCKEQLT